MSDGWFFLALSVDLGNLAQKPAPRAVQFVAKHPKYLIYQTMIGK